MTTPISRSMEVWSMEGREMNFSRQILILGPLSTPSTRLVGGAGSIHAGTVGIFDMIDIKNVYT